MTQPVTPPQGSPSRTKRLLAFYCRICPLCVAARHWPQSAFARALTRIERTCPCCRAYSELYGRSATGADRRPPPAGA